MATTIAGLNRTIVGERYSTSIFPIGGKLSQKYSVPAALETRASVSTLWSMHGRKDFPATGG